jgi:hypothetical protein
MGKYNERESRHQTDLYHPNPANEFAMHMSPQPP